MAPVVLDETWRLLRALGLLVMAAMLGVQVMPGLRPHRRAILAAALALYGVGAAAVLGWRYLGG
ncbi:MAG: hypothetical protein BGP12_05725 [Rhodospirillales bacterium 70-18]|nr:hypothetical protein [Rhodospirillales bacterium]OJY76939.1 MAG: hypothetical protein BGP12_05725 [Rhodospirillales bacterium 70-18]